MLIHVFHFFFFFQAEDGIRDVAVTGVQTCALPISQRATADAILEVRNQRSGVEGLEHAWRLCQAGWAGQAGHERVGGGEERPSGERHAAAERAACEAPAGIAARPERAGPAQPVDRRALAAETLPQPSRRIVGVVRDAQLLGAREEPTHQPAPDLPTVPGGHHQLSRDGHTDRLPPRTPATLHYPNQTPYPPPPVLR